MAQSIETAKRRGQLVVQDFNKRFTPNTPCFYQPVRGEDKWYPTRTRSEAWLLGHGEPVVKVDGASGCVCISHLAMPGSDRYEASIAESEEARGLHNAEWVPFSDEEMAARDEADHQDLITKLQQLGEEFGCPGGVQRTSWLRGRLATLEKLETELANGELSDGNHTFNELYAHRVRLFTLLMHAHKARAWWSLKHSDGTQYDGWMIAGIDTPAGPVTYHLPESEVALMPVGLQLPMGKEWDGHTANDVLERLISLAGSDVPDEDRLVYQYSVWVNTERGQVHHDGVIYLPIIRGIGDYMKARQLIADDLIAAGVPVPNPIVLNVSTLSAIGEVE